MIRKKTSSSRDGKLFISEVDETPEDTALRNADESLILEDLKPIVPTKKKKRRNSNKGGKIKNPYDSSNTDEGISSPDRSGVYPLRSVSEYAVRKITRLVNPRTDRLNPFFLFRNVHIKPCGFRYSKYSSDWISKIGYKLAASPSYIEKNKGSFSIYKIQDIESIFDFVTTALQLYCIVSNYQVLAKNLTNDDLSSNQLLKNELENVLVRNLNINSMTIHGPLTMLKQQLNRCYLPPEMVEFVKEMSTPVWASEGGRETLIFPSVWLPLFKDLKNRSEDSVNLIANDSVDTILFPTDERFMTDKREGRYRLINVINQMESALNSLFTDDDLLYDFTGIADELIPSFKINIEDGRDTQLPYRFKTKGECFSDELGQKFNFCEPKFSLKIDDESTLIERTIPRLFFDNNETPIPLDVLCEGQKNDVIGRNLLYYDSTVIQIESQSEIGMNIKPDDMKYFSWSWSISPNAYQDLDEDDISSVINASGLSDFIEGFVIFGPSSSGFSCPYRTIADSFIESTDRNFVFGNSEMNYLSIGLKSGLAHDSTTPIVKEIISKEVLDTNGIRDEILSEDDEILLPSVIPFYLTSDKMISFLINIDKLNKDCYEDFSNMWNSTPLNEAYDKRERDGVKLEGKVVDLIKDYLNK